jgi:hypothetical protein
MTDHQVERLRTLMRDGLPVPTPERTLLPASAP